MNDDAGRLLHLVEQDVGWNISGLLQELHDVPRRIFAVREKVAPLKAELAMLKARYESKGRSPSHFDIRRSLLLSELKEEARVIYYRNPDFKEAAKGRQVRIELTDGRAEDIAHAHPRYRKFVEEAEEDHRRIAEIGKQLSPLFDRIEGLRGRRDYLIQRIEMARALTYAWKAERDL